MTVRLLRASLGLVACTSALAGCDRAAPPTPAPARSTTITTQAGKPELPRELVASGAPGARTAPTPSATPSAPPLEAAPVAAPPEAPTAWSAAPSVPSDYKGPLFVVTSLAAGVYVDSSFDSKKIGYLRNGSRVPVSGEATSKKNCTGGWYHITSGGFVCGNLGTTDLARSEVKFAGGAPNLAEVLPYPYARNAKNGTPLYHSVPSREQMEKYEPYLLERAESSDSKGEKRSALQKASASGGSTSVSTTTTTSAASPVELGAALADGGLVAPTAPADPEPDKPWWQREDSKDKLHELKLHELESDADDVLAKRMVAGFYVAVDKTFRWNNRSWYKTTKGLVAPSDRFWQTAGPKFKGVELDGATWKLPVAWVYGGRKSIGSYEIDADAKTIKNAKSYDRFEPIALAGKTLEHGGTRYEQLVDGTWVKQAQVRITKPGAMPQGLGANERWIDVNLKAQTLVAYVGERPIYATLISSGKESKIKDKDHSTPTGEWRIREKHITTTMDGDGTAAGDLPYSIEDVPYVMYFHRAYALHGAFWHNNFGVQMSHGCVNLAPLDAKYLFFFADPPIPAGFHGVWSSEAHPGTRVVIHE
ncbi:MAG: L,D-transpeptidase [Polyangiaceae bacterium]